MQWKAPLIVWLISLVALSLAAGYFFHPVWGGVVFIALLAGYRLYTFRNAPKKNVQPRAYQQEAPKEQKSMIRAKHDITRDDEDSSPQSEMNALMPEEKALRLAEVLGDASVIETLKLALTDREKFVNLYTTVLELAQRVPYGDDRYDEMAALANSQEARDLGISLEGLYTGGADSERFEAADYLAMSAAELSCWSFLFGMEKAGLTGHCDWDFGSEDILWHFESLLRAHNLAPISQSEFERLWASSQESGVDDWYMPDLSPALASIAEARGKRLVFLNTHSDEYVFSLLPLAEAARWGGQELGEGKMRLEVVYSNEIT